MTSPIERDFATYPRGDRREEQLANFRIGMRALTNPSTGLPFTETEIATATGLGSRYYNEADAIDVVLTAEQSRALWLADQVRPDRAGTAFLQGYHSSLWQLPYLKGTGSSGPAAAKALPGTVFAGSTTFGDPAALVCTDPAGLRYQVRTTVFADGNGVVTPSLVAVDAGTVTNIPSGTTLTWVAPPLNAQPKATASDNFTGGTDDETDAEFVKRLLARIRHKQAAGNQSQMRSWARDASNAVEDACVYACAMHAGSTVVCVLQKRAGAIGPTARVASLATLSAVTSYLVPKKSPVVPARAHIVVLAAVPQASDVALELSMSKGVSSGWSDPTPWPAYMAGPVTIMSAPPPTQTAFRVQSDTPIATGAAAPKLMVWNEVTSRFEALLVASVSGNGSGLFDVVLAQAPLKTLAVGDFISPDTGKRELLAQTVEAYFDGLGPGEIVDLATDDRAHRAFRFPKPNEELPSRAGSSITSRLTDAMGFSLSDAQLLSMSVSAPAVPADPVLGPSLLTVGRVAVYPG